MFTRVMTMIGGNTPRLTANPRFRSSNIDNSYTSEGLKFKVILKQELGKRLFSTASDIFKSFIIICQ